MRDQQRTISCVAESADAWTSGVRHANGIDIHIIRSGGRKASVIALHGLIGSGACLRPAMRPLTGEFDVILPDARGHGGSDAPASGYLYEDHSADVVGLIETLDIRRPALLGRSMGGMTAAVTSSTLGSAVAALVLVDPTFISSAWQQEVFESGVAEGHRHDLASSKEKLRAQARARHPHRSDEVIDSLVDAKLRTSLHAFEVLTPPNPNYRTLVQAMVVPTLPIIGDRGVVSLDTARELQKLTSMLTVEVVPGAGHGLPYDQPETVGAMVSAFLSAMADP